MSKKTEFRDLPLNKELQLSVIEAGYTYPTEIQAKVIPPVVEGGDVIAAAPTGSGKSAAYLLPIMQKIMENRKSTKNGEIRALIILPTRELVIQTRDFILNFSTNIKVSTVEILGGVGISPQLQALRTGREIAIATPGRLVDLIERDDINLEDLDFFVLDEIDRMLQMGFLPDINKIVKKLPYHTQALFFSATISPETAKLAGRVLNAPLQIDIQNKIDNLTLPENINFHALFADKGRKRKLIKWITTDITYSKILIFVNSKVDAERLDRDLITANINHGVIHGDKSNNDRQTTIEKFNRGRTKILIATDIAARGFDPKELSHVVHYTVPSDVETFFHRSGRTGRAGNGGEVFILCDQFDRNRLYRIAENIDGNIEPFPWQPYHSDKIESMTVEESREKENGERSRKLDKKIAAEERKADKEVDRPIVQKKSEPTRRANGLPVRNRKDRITGKGRQKSNRPSNKVQRSLGKRH